MTDTPTIAQREKIVQAYLKGWSVRKIREEFGLWHDRNTLTDILREEGVSIRGPGKPPLSEQEFERRRKAGRRAATVAEYCSLIGQPLRDYLTAKEKANGVVIGGKG